MTLAELEKVIVAAIKLFPVCFSPGQSLLLAAYGMLIIKPDWDSEEVLDIYFSSDPEQALELFEAMYVEV